MRAAWFVGGEIKELVSGTNPEQNIFSCSLASARLRMAVAAVEWSNSGHENIFWDPEQKSISIDWAATDVCVVPKFMRGFQTESWVSACREAVNFKRKLILDICDYPFNKSDEVHAFYSEVLKVCDVVVVNSFRMAEIIAPYSKRTPCVIEDAILGAVRRPEFSPEKQLNLLWYGHPSNLDYLVSSIEPLAQFASHRHCVLTIITQEGAGIFRFIKEINSHFEPCLQAHFVRWSLENMRIALRKCDLVLIPSNPSDPNKTGVSANRLAEAFRAGRFVVAAPLPSYMPFAEAAWLDNNLIAGIEWALANRRDVLERIHLGQQLVAEKFDAVKIGRQWVNLFGDLEPPVGCSDVRDLVNT
jgi:hypothetical protein